MLGPVSTTPLGGAVTRCRYGLQRFGVRSCRLQCSSGAVAARIGLVTGASAGLLLRRVLHLHSLPRQRNAAASRPQLLFTPQLRESEGNSSSLELNERSWVPSAWPWT